MAEYDGRKPWEISRSMALPFFEWLHQETNTATENIDLSMVERDQVHLLFEAFALQLKQQEQQQGKDLTKNQERRLEGLVMAALRQQKCLKTKKYNDGVVVCSFARSDKSYAPLQERQTARDKLLQDRQEMHSDKGGVCVSDEAITNPKGPVLPINHRVTVQFVIWLNHDAQTPLELKDIRLGGSHKKFFSVTTKTPVHLSSKSSCELLLSFRATRTSVYRVNITLYFQDKQGRIFAILRSVLLRSGDADMYDIVKPRTPYVKKKRNKFERPMKKENVKFPPKQNSPFKYDGLRAFKIPIDVRQLLENKEMEASLVRPSHRMSSKNFENVYTSFWQSLLWTSELQAHEDIKLFDMEDAALEHAGRFLKLYVAGLAEGRPSVLRGDLVNCSWKGTEYRGRVTAVEQLEVLMEFHHSFHKKFNVNLDRVERIRFTFTRTSFRTSHAGAVNAPTSMGPIMLMPNQNHISQIQNNQHQRTERIHPQKFRWASKSLNDEQKQAVQEITKGSMRPMPYVIFGPPGTGKTTTIVEAVFQLANLHTYDKNNRQPKLKILLVAPSNDATDILVEKLATYFPPSEMIRVLAYTRTIDQVPDLVRRYCHQGLEPWQLIEKITNVQITVATVNMASRLWCTGEGVPEGYFDVLCVDEAGHTTEPEVIAIAATIMKFKGGNPGQLVLAGDPMQLGPIITSELCKKFGMAQSYMERLVNTIPAYSLNDSSNSYPQELVTLLVNNYRSHPDILKLPNEMFYRNQLIPCGDQFTTHSMSKWEHLPNKGFPVLFHAVDGENTREGSSPSWFNPQEALIVVDYVKNLVKHSRPPIRQEEIGVITPYARQVQKIRLALKVSDIGDVKVGSVETFQGQERRIIIISTVRSENELLEQDRKYNLGFVANEKRFNVAVTRAKALLIVIGNPRVLATDEKNWLPLLRFCRDNGSWLGEEWDESEVLSESEDEGFEKVEGAGDDSDEWEIVAQEATGFINREE